MQETLCYSDEDCPSIGYRCYSYHLFQLSGPGICHCWSSLALSGYECRSETYSKIVCCMIFSISFALFVFSIHCLISNIHRLSFNAFTTTLLQNTLGSLSSCISYGFCIDRVFYPGSNAFWKLKVYYYFACAAVIHEISSMLNISLMLKDISGFHQSKLFKMSREPKISFWDL